MIYTYIYIHITLYNKKMLVIPKAGAVGYAAKGVAGAVRKPQFFTNGTFGGENKQSCYTTGSIPDSKKFRKSTKS